MEDNKDNKIEKEEVPVEKLPLDAKLLSNAVIELNISRRNVAIYPIGHDIIKKSIDKSFDYLKKLFEIRKNITLLIAESYLIIDEYILDKQNPVFKDFAFSVYDMGIASINFNEGLTKDELVAFLKVITQKTDGSYKEDEIKELFKEKGIKNINVFLIDYSAFQMVKDETAKPESSEKIWEKYVYGLTEGKLITDKDMDYITDIPSAELATIFNNTLVEKTSQIDYDGVITSYLRKSSERSSASFVNLMNFIDGLKPNLKKQFLSGTFTRLAKDSKQTEHILSSLNDDNLMDVLNEINKNDELIPASLKRLLEKFSSLGDINIKLYQNPQIRGKYLIDDIILSQEISGLFSQEKFEEYMPDDYIKAISRITITEHAATFNMVPPEIKLQLDSRFIREYYNDMLFGFIENDLLSPDEYANVVESLTQKLQYLCETGQFKEITRTFIVLKAQLDKEAYSRASESALTVLTSGSFMKKLVQEMKYWRQKRDELIVLAAQLRDHIIPYLFNGLTEEEDATSRKFFITILSSYSENIANKIIERLNDNRWYVIRNMIHLLRECGINKHMEYIIPLCHNPNIRVRFEAIKTLLHFNHPDSLTFLKENLKTKNEEIKQSTINLIGIYRVKSLLPLLINMLEKKAISGEDYLKKIPVIDALGKIGDTSVINSLERLYEKKSLLFNKVLEHVKEETFKTLNNYPYDSVKSLLLKGQKSGNKRIQIISNELTQKMHLKSITT